MGALARLPGWARRLDEMSGHFSEAGLNGLLDYHAEMNPLGELLARGEVTPTQVKEFLDGLRKPMTAGADAVAAVMPNTDPSPTDVILRTSPDNFWTVAWSDILGEEVMRKRKIVVPPLPTLKAKTKTAITGGLGTWIPIYLPQGLTESDYPTDFIKPAWGKYLTVGDIQRRPLPGRWAIVETIPKPNWDDQNGYGNGNDPLAQTLGLKSRFGVSWDDFHQISLPNLAKQIGLSKKAVRLPTAEEWNLIGNLFLWLNANRSANLPDLGSTNSWEWCENSDGDGNRLVVGDRGLGGLADVDYNWHGLRDAGIGFRVLAVL